MQPAANLTYKDLPTIEKAKASNCSRWNFYSKKCQKCKFKLICSDQ
jgi:radical SAM protein with 4Fe4S-binding SPASM domain